jgi:ElaB/YqjD/DUF883 family membrane-anchored ribosome-binding protein
LGKNFAGKKRIAKHLKKSLGLEILVLEDIIIEAMDACKVVDPTNPTGGARRSKMKKVSKTAPKKGNPKSSAVIDESEGPSAAQLEFAAIGEKISVLRQEEEDIHDEILCELLIKKLQCLFPKSSKRCCVNKYMALVDEKEKLLADANYIPGDETGGVHASGKKTAKDPKKEVKKGAKDIPEESEAKLIDTDKYLYTEGFIIIGFPLNETQARMWDNMLTGYVPMEERLNKEAEDKKVIARRLMSIPEWEPEETAFPSFDLNCYIHVSDENCKARSEGLKIDQTTGEIYSNANPPPDGDKKLLDRLEDLPVDVDAMEKNFCQVNNSIDSIEQWYSQFGQVDTSTNEVLKPFLRISNEEFDSEEENLRILGEKICKVLDWKYRDYKDAIRRPDDLILSFKGDTIQSDIELGRSAELNGEAKNGMSSNLDLAIPKVVDGNGKPISMVGTDSRSNLDDGSPIAGKSSIGDRNQPKGLLIRDEISPEFPGQGGSPGVKSEQPARISG